MAPLIFNDLEPFTWVQIVIIAIAAILVALYKIWDYQKISKINKESDFRKSFNTTLAGLYSQNESEKIASAILLRRFLINKDKIYKTEALNVLSSLLRVEKYGEYQKTLADSFSWAGNFNGQDLQYTNLQNMCIKKQWEVKEDIVMDEADLFSADLSYATLRDVTARKAIFLNCNLMNCTFRNCILTNADFRCADLKNTRFIDCKMLGAKFENASNIPENIRPYLNEKWEYTTQKKEVKSTGEQSVNKRKTIFFSCAGNMTPKQSDYVASLENRLNKLNVQHIKIDRKQYRKSGQLGNIRSEIEKCDGVIIIGFKYMIVHDGICRPGTTEKKNIAGHILPTPWNNIEAGMACAIGKPILLLYDPDMREGIFDPDINDKKITRISMSSDEAKFNEEFIKWVHAL